MPEIARTTVRRRGGVNRLAGDRTRNPVTEWRVGGASLHVFLAGVERERKKSSEGFTFFKFPIIAIDNRRLASSGKYYFHVFRPTNEEGKKNRTVVKNGKNFLILFSLYVGGDREGTHYSTGFYKPSVSC